MSSPSKPSSSEKNSNADKPGSSGLRVVDVDEATSVAAQQDAAESAGDHEEQTFPWSLVLIVVTLLLTVVHFGFGVGMPIWSVPHAHAEPISQIRMSPTGRLCVTMDTGGGVKLWDASRQTLLWDVPNHDHEAVFADIDKGGRRLFTLDKEGMLRIFDITGRRMTNEVRPNAIAADLSEDGQLLALGLRTGILDIYQSHGDRLERLVSTEWGGGSFCFSPSRKYLAASEADGIYLYQVIPNLQRIAVIPYLEEWGSSSFYTNLKFEPNERHLTAIKDGTAVAVWQVRDRDGRIKGKPVQLIDPRQPIVTYSFCDTVNDSLSDGLIAVQQADGVTTFWQAETGKHSYSRSLSKGLFAANDAPESFASRDAWNEYVKDHARPQALSLDSPQHPWLIKAGANRLQFRSVGGTGAKFQGVFRQDTFWRSR